MTLYKISKNEMNKLSLNRSFGLMATALLLAVGGFFVANISFAVISSTFTDVETVANLSAINDQDAVTLTTVPNVTAGVNDQAAVTATTVANANLATATVTVDTNVTVTADVAGSVGNALSIEIVQSTSNMGASTNATIVVTKTGNAILATVAHNSNPNADGSNPIDVTRASVVQALNMSAGGAIQGGFVTVTITNDVTGDITASGGDASTVGTVGATSLAGGSDAVAQINTITINGTPEEGDVFTATLPTVGAVNYTVLVTDTTNDLIAAGLNGAIQASAGYAGQDFTSGVATNVITLTAKVAGTGFVQTSGAVDRVTSQVNEITISGTVEENDVFTATLPVDGAVNYTVLVSDTTTDDIATGLNNAIQTSVNYGIDFTSGISGSVITLTATTPGTGFVQTSGATNRTPIAQVVTFTPASVSVGETFIATINLNDYDYLSLAGDVEQDVVEALQSLMDADSDVDCVENDVMVTCTASVAGTPFTFNADVDDVTAPVISSLSFTPDDGYAKIGDVITLNITSDQLGYSAGAITVNGVAVAGFSDNGGGLYSVTYTVVSGDTDRASGATPASVVLNDGDGNSNVAYTTVTANTLKIDANAPTLVSAQTTSTTTIDVTFNEDLNGATPTNADFLVAGVNPVNTDEISAGVIQLTVAVPFSTDATPAVEYVGSVTDLAGNPAALFGPITPDDGVAPVLAEVAPVPTPDNDSTPDYTFSAGEAGAISYGGDCSSATAVAVVGPNTTTFNSLSDGPHSNCTITVTDSSGNASLALAVSSFTIDTVPPSVVLSSLVTDPTNDSPILVTATFSEDVTGFSGPFDIGIVNGTLQTFTQISGSIYNFNVLPASQGLVTVDVDANSAIDTAGNDNTAATQFGITYDSVPPVITMLGASPVNIEYGETYIDDGAIASDPLPGDGDVTGSIVVVDPVDTSTLGTYLVTYNVADTAGNNAIEVTRTVNVVPRAITVTAVTDTKVYDGGPDSSGTPTITSGSPAFGDGEDFVQSFDTKDVGVGKTLAPSGVMDDGNGGANYAVTFVADTTGEITEKDLTVTATGINKVYDGTTAATVTLSDDRVPGDVLVLNYTDADFDDKNVGTGKDVSVSGISISGADAGNYNANTTADTTADITLLAITGSITADNKVYDNNNSATIATRTLTGAIVGDDVSYTGGTATFDTEDVGTGKLVSATDLSLSGADSGNYTVNTTANTTADITPLALVGSITADNKVYDGNISAVISGRFLAGVVGADDVSYTGGTATFDNKNAGTGKTVSGTGFTLTGADAGNYTANSSANTTADITPLAIIGSISADNKVYDNNNSATISTRTLTGVVLGDDVTYTGGTATFDNESVGTGKTVTAVGLSLTGLDAVNYTVNTTANTTADINSPGSSGGGGGGGNRRATPPAPAPGEVLGEQTGPQFVFTLLLKQGVAASAEVMELQKFLNAAGFGPLVVDGKFGPLTKAAVIKFQLANGLVGDGVVGPLTRAVLNKPQ